MTYRTNDIRYSSQFQPGDEIWAFAFAYTNNKTDKMYYQQPVLGQFQDRNTDFVPPTRNGYNYSAIQFFVPYKKNKKELAWSKAVKLDARLYADTEQEAIDEYNRLVTLAQNWHYLSAMLLSEHFIGDRQQDLLITEAHRNPNLKAVDYSEFLLLTANGKIPETARCHLEIRPGTCLKDPLILDNQLRAATIQTKAILPGIDLTIPFEDLPRLVNFGKIFGKLTIYVEN